MNYIGTLFIIILMFTGIQIIACPTCVGKIKKDGPPFFDAQFYQPHTTESTVKKVENTNQFTVIYQEYLKKKGNKS